jgi:predicted metal-binding membrane protein
MTSSSALESILKRDRLIVISGLAAVASLAWAYTLAGVGMGMNAFEMTAMGDAGAASAPPTPWSPARALAVFLMWFVMMIAMMLPSAAPMVLLFTAIARKRQTQPKSEIGAAAFAAGYLAIWGVFSAGAALAQWAFETSRLLTPMMQSTNALFDGLLLLAAGIYQLTSLKQACLGRCRQPVSFITQYWRSGTGGAFRMGVAHGTFCLGCCWFLMALLFFGGVMNLYWIAGIATYVLAEKFLPHQRWLSRAAGWALIVLAATILARAAWET